MTNYNRFHINWYLKVTCNILFIVDEGFPGGFGGRGGGGPGDTIFITGIQLYYRK